MPSNVATGRKTRARSGGRVRRKQIRDAALTLFSERGYYGTSMEDIAAHIGMRASSLYNHTPSKQSLLADIMLTTMRELLLGFGSATSRHTEPAAQLRAAMIAHVQYHGTHQRDVRIGNHEINSLAQPGQDEVKALRRQYARAWQSLIERGVEESVFAARHPRLAAYALLEMGIGVAQWYRPHGVLSLEEIASDYGDMALRQVGCTEISVVSLSRRR